MSLNEEQLLPGSIVTLQSSLAQRRLAIIIGVGIIVLALISLPIARDQWVSLDSFLPIYTTAIFFAELITGSLFISQFLAVRRPSILILAATYFSSSLISIPYLLSFPGVIAAQNFLGSDAQTTSWMWIFWHLLFPIGILSYVAVEKFWSTRARAHSQLNNTEFWWWSILVGLVTLGVVLLLTAIAYYSNDWLPVLVQQGNYTLLLTSGVGPFIWFLNSAALISLLLFIRGHSVAQLWLIVAVLAWLLDTLISVLGGTRFSGGWYMSRVNSLLAACIVLAALFFEIRILYNRLLSQDEALRSALRARDDFINLAAHELKTPITSLRGYAQYLLRQLDKKQIDQGRLETSLKSLDEQSLRLSRLVERLLDISSLEKGKLSLVKSQTDLAELIGTIINQLSLGAVHRHEIEARLPDRLLANVDAMRLEQVVINLLDNAIKYSPQGSKIEISLRLLTGTDTAGDNVSTPKVELVVKDYGIGISSEDLKLIFEPYYQHDARAASGLGLGLYISRQIIQLHEGTITAYSLPEGGTSFVVCLPQNL